MKDFLVFLLLIVAIMYGLIGIGFGLTWPVWAWHLFL